MLLTCSIFAVTGGALYTCYRESEKKKRVSWLRQAGNITRETQRTLLTVAPTEGRFLSATFAYNTPEQQLGEASAYMGKTAQGEVEKKLDRHIIVSLGSLGLIIGGTFLYPPLKLLSLPGLLYVYRPWLEDAYTALFKERRVRMAVVDGVLVLVFLTSGLYLAGALVASLFSLSKKLLFKVEDHSQKRLVDVFSGVPRVVSILKEQVEREIPFEELEKGDVVVVYAGEIIPVDGTILQGYATIDQHLLTGESQPAEKGPEDPVFALTVILSGKIYVTAENAGRDTAAARIGEILNHTADFRHSLQWQWMKTVDKTALPALAGGIVTQPILGSVGAIGMLFSLSALGYGMRVVAPITLMNFLNLSSRSHILIKDGRSLELLNQVDTIVFDKTGTLTKEQPTVSKIHTVNGYTENEVLIYALAAEYKQVHPIAQAIQEEACQRGLSTLEVDEARYEIGYGLTVRIQQDEVRVGSPRFMELEGISIPSTIGEIQANSSEQGDTLVCVAVNKHLGGAIVLQPTIRSEAERIISQLREHDMSMYIISGDSEKPTQKLAEKLGITHYFAEILPENKAALIEQLQKEGKCVCFVGDGINDSIALKKANVSISLQGASTVAIDTAQIILMDKSLNQLAHLFDLGRNFDTSMQRSFLITMFPNLIAAGGVLFLHSGVLAPILLYYAGMALALVHSSLSSWQEGKSRKEDSQEMLPKYLRNDKRWESDGLRKWVSSNKG